MKKNYPVSRKANLVVQEMDSEVLIYDLTENKAFCLNEISALVWQACDGEKSIAEISEFISQKLNSLANEDLVWFAIDQLKKEKLLENGDELSNYFVGMSRREIIKKVGLSSMVVLPIVSSMIAPIALHAQSACTRPTSTACSCPNGTGTGNPCTNATCTALSNRRCCNVVCNAGGNNCNGTCA